MRTSTRHGIVFAAAALALPCAVALAQAGGIKRS